jgi:hypothetical protein
MNAIVYGNNPDCPNCGGERGFYDFDGWVWADCHECADDEPPDLDEIMAEKDARYRAAAAAVEDGSDPLALVRMTGATYAKEPE